MLRKIGLGIATLALAVAVTACTMGQGVTVPERDVMIDAQINAALANLNLGVPVQVETAQGMLTLSMVQ